MKDSVLRLVVVCFVFFELLTGCKDPNVMTVEYVSEVEIAPGKWLPLNYAIEVCRAEWDARTRTQQNPHQLSIVDTIKQFADLALDSNAADTITKLESAFTFEWHGKKGEWKGKEFPITLRENGDVLYLVGFNRQEIHNCRLVFFKLRNDGSSFERIHPSDFPRQIATQNMSINLLNGRRHVRVGIDLIDTWQVLRTLDLGSPYFSLSLTAAMWYQIENGTEYEQIRKRDLVTKKFLEDYAAKYKPIALPTIVKEP